MADAPVIVRTQAEVQRMLRACLKTAQDAGLTITGLEVEIRSDRFRAAVICGAATPEQTRRLEQERAPPEEPTEYPGGRTKEEMLAAFRAERAERNRRSDERRAKKEAIAAAAAAAKTTDPK